MNDQDRIRIETIARCCHEVNRAYCLSLGDASQPEWDHAPEWQRKSAINGVRFHLAHSQLPNPSRASHDNWAKEKLADGWKYGPVKDPVKKEHPCLVEYEELPQAQRAKDDLFVAVVKSLGPGAVNS